MPISPFFTCDKNTITEQRLLRRNRGIGFLLALGTSLIMTLATPPITAQAENQRIRNIVLVHGAFADGSSWNKVVPELQRLGYHVTAVQNPLTSLEDDVAATQRVLQRQHGDVLLVGHSWAGAVITQAGNAANVKGLVYLSALAPDSGESVEDMMHNLNSPMEGLKPDDGGFVWLDDPDTYHDVMANDIPKDEARVLAAVQQPIAASSFKEKVRQAAWHTKPSWYLGTTNDHALLPALQIAIARRIGAKRVSIDSSHLSQVSHPHEVAILIDEAARMANTPTPAVKKIK